MEGSSESVGDNVVISLSRKEGRKAKIACMKEKEGDEHTSHLKEAEKEFSRAFDKKDKSYYEDTRYVMSPRAATSASRAIETHASYRKDKGELNSYKAYKSIADKIRSQITMQGVVLD